ncbi:DNA cross-link repair 1A [Solea senegalensis]|uniref:DNA cross-link repair 1A protein n=1 Tax=Solea senegalensis TaxID=28829 RepID=A0AAV6RRM7_SOLSE|nr:DNA cross-link repair 1A protein [Solea senegalensis]KAG7507440.1 DNA cross-link repair 1A [Solea senegalensis]
MSLKDDSENDIWEYKSIGKRKKTPEQLPGVRTVSKRRCTLRKACRRDTVVSVETFEGTEKGTKVEESTSVKDGHSNSEKFTLPLESSASCEEAVHTVSAAAEGLSSVDFCPMCQIPLSALVVQSQRWHVAECVDIPRHKCTECPDGLQCSSTIPSHYKNFNHTLLAHSRANGDAALLSLSQQAENNGESSFSHLPGLIKNEVDDLVLDNSQDRAVSPSVLSPHNSNNTRTPPSKLTNGLLLLRSPGPEDLKKKKGWSSSTKRNKPVRASQESKTEPEEVSGGQGCDGSSKCEPHPENDDFISYSPLSELPPQAEDSKSECRKQLFNGGAYEFDDNDKSVILLSDGFSSEDELLTQFIDNFETNKADLSSSNIQLEPVPSLAPTDQPAAAERRAGSTQNEAASAVSPCKTSIQSPQSIVLERLRENLLSSDSLDLRNLNETIQLEQPHTNSHQVPAAQTSTPQRPQTMTPQKGQSKAAHASGLKQTDIGVFFGLKPLKVKEKVAESGPNELNPVSTPMRGENSGHRRPRRDGQRKSRADTTTNTSQGTATVGSSNAVNTQGGARSGWSSGWRSRRNRVDANGEVQLPRCPFYKKIPGTKFVIDAFQYGEIEGIAAYFLTHFHSDHYGGLTKNSTLPIYCNKITGNLVKSKLKVAEQYVHVLPMNTQVTVEGVRVILLDANHCPGAAMLLFFLPDGQTVLHTGDFRADPSMETYPELLSCRVQTLYLDTTYCSPEYTFPRQQEVVNFAANTAFELVTLNPRTLVVCGSYSVGKEKVFLALADILGSKVCLSRDKYNTMCCLESEEIKQRITTDWKAAQVHVLPMMQISFNKLQQHLARFTTQYDQLVAFKPTGWTFSQQVESVEDIEPAISGNVSIYGVPYSEHSGFLELKRFVQWVQPLKIIPTVNNGSWTSRKAMEKCFSEWLKETKSKR